MYEEEYRDIEKINRNIIQTIITSLYLTYFKAELEKKKNKNKTNSREPSN